MQRVFVSDYWTIDRDTRRALVIVRRTPVPYPSLGAISKIFDALEAAMDACGRPRFSVLIDLRDAIGRNDPEFERATASHPRRLTRDFIRSAVLVRTANGVLQIQRAAKVIGNRAPAFTSEAEALSYLFPAAKDSKPTDPS